MKIPVPAALNLELPKGFKGMRMVTRGYDFFRSYGSLAYNFQARGNENAGVYGTVFKKKKSARSIPDKGVSPAMIVGVCLCAVLVFISLMLRVSLVVISDETIALQNEINLLQEQQTSLKLRHAELYSFEETEKYAIEVLGMKKPGLNQIRYLDFSVDNDLIYAE